MQIRLHGKRETGNALFAVSRFPFPFSIFVIGLLVFCSLGGAAEDSLSKKNQQTQYEKRLQILANRYSRAKAGTVEFPKELMAIDFINEGYKLFQKNQYDLAREAALNALKYDPKSPVAHELVGDVAYLKQNLSEADEHYKTAYSIEASQRLKDKIQKLSRETATEKNLNSVEEVHFLIKYDRNQSEYEGFELRSLLHDTYRGLSTDLAHYLNHKTTVLFYKPEQFHQVGNLPHWVGGLFDGKVRLPVNPRGLGEKQLRAVTRHEVAHVFIDDISHKQAPSWLHEGFAVYQQNKTDQLPKQALRILAEPKNLIPFAELFNPSVFASHSQDQVWMNRFYIQSYDLVDYIIGRYGQFYIKQLAIAFSESKNVEQAFQDVLKTSVTKMEKEWKANLASSFR